MPYRTPHGRRYHATLGCHGATISCGTGGLLPCWYCDAGLREQRRKARKARRQDGAGSGSSSTNSSHDGSFGTTGRAQEDTQGDGKSIFSYESPLADEFSRVATIKDVSFASLPEHYYEERFAVPSDVTARGLAMLGIDSMAGLRDVAGTLSEHAETVEALIDENDTLGGLALALAVKGAVETDRVDDDGGWAVVTPEKIEEVLEQLRRNGVERPNAFRIPGNLRLVTSLDSDAIDVTRGREDMTAADIALAMSCTKRSGNGPYQLLHYDQLACYVSGYMGGINTMWSAYDGFLTELRGTVYDTRSMSVVSNPYYKFRNLNECEDYSEANLRAAIEANGGRMVATEKLDGSLIQLRYVQDEDRQGGAWQNGMLVSTSNTLEGSSTSRENSHLVNVERLYIQNLEDPRYRELAQAYPNHTMCFEFVRPDVDPHVVTYDESDWGLWLTGMRDVGTGRLASHEEVAEAADRFGIPHPKVVATNLEECLRVVNEGDGSRMEGMVVDVNGWLIKMKLTDFLALSHIHHSIEGASGFREVLRMTHEGTLDDALGGLSEDKRVMVDSIVARAGAYQTGMSEAIDSIMASAPDPTAGRKEFATWVRSQPIPSRWKSYIFARIDDKESPVYYADRYGANLNYLTRNELAEREAELEVWRDSQRSRNE